MEGHLDTEQLKSMNYKGLQALAKDMGVNASGKTEDIIARIAAVEVGIPGDEFTEEENALFDTEAAEQEATEDAEAAEQEATEDAEAAEQEATEDAEAAAGLVKVKVVTRFLDKQLNQVKDAGEAYSVNRERAAQLVAAGVAEIV